MIILWVAITAILVVENIVLNYYSYVFMWYTSAWMLSLISVWVGTMIGFWLKWVLSSESQNSDDSDNYDF